MIDRSMSAGLPAQRHDHRDHRGTVHRRQVIGPTRARAGATLSFFFVGGPRRGGASSGDTSAADSTRAKAAARHSGYSSEPGLEIAALARGIRLLQRFGGRRWGVPLAISHPGGLPLRALPTRPTLGAFFAANRRPPGAEHGARRAGVISAGTDERPRRARCHAAETWTDCLAAIWGAPWDGTPRQTGDVVQAPTAGPQARGPGGAQPWAEDTGGPGSWSSMGGGFGGAALTPAGPVATRLGERGGWPWAPLVGRNGGSRCRWITRAAGHHLDRTAFDGHPQNSDCRFVHRTPGRRFYCPGASRGHCLDEAPADIGAHHRVTSPGGLSHAGDRRRAGDPRIPRGSTGAQGATGVAGACVPLQRPTAAGQFSTGRPA